MAIHTEYSARVNSAYPPATRHRPRWLARARNTLLLGTVQVNEVMTAESAEQGGPVIDSHTYSGLREMTTRYPGLPVEERFHDRAGAAGGAAVVLLQGLPGVAGRVAEQARHGGQLAVLGRQR